MDNISLVLKKRLAYALRHNPDQYGLVMSNEGQVNVETVCEALKITIEELTTIVKTDNKNRFTIHDGMIWANQGHSVSVNIPLVKHTLATVPPIAYHGTKLHIVTSILSEGLIKKERQFVHLSKIVNDAVEVSNRRNGDLCILTVNVRLMVEDGFDIFESSNGVILVDYVPVEYIKVFQS